MTLTKNKPFYLHEKHQSAITSNKRFQILIGGRAGMKTEAVARIFINYARTEKNIRLLCTRKYQSSIKDSVYQVLLQAIIDAGLEDEFEILKNSIVHKYTNSEFIFYGLQMHISEIKSMKGIKYVWIEEAQYVTEDIMEDLSKTIRILGAKIFIVFNPQLETDYVYQRFILNNDPLANVIWTSYLENPFFKPEIVGSLYDEMLMDKQNNYAKYLHLWEGECKKEVENALWKNHLIKHQQIDPESLEKIVVAIDPSTTAHKNSDACGLVVAGKINKDFYVLEDETTIMTPNEWAEKSIQLYYQYNADRIIAEGNQGGDMIKTIIHQKDSSIRVRTIHATRGKILRAEPILQLYEQERVYHCKCFTQLEYEMVTYTGDPKQKSPNALDAMVYALTELSSNRFKDVPGMGIPTSPY